MKRLKAGGAGLQKRSGSYNFWRGGDAVEKRPIGNQFSSGITRHDGVYVY